MKGSPSFRNRLLVALLLTALVPASVLLVAGSWVLREVVVSTGSAGAWDEVGDSGRDLLSEVEDLDNPPPELVSAATQHHEKLAESLRLSRLYGFLGERALSLLPVVVVLLLILAGGAALLSANRIARSLSRPLEEIVRWTRALGSSLPLPPPDPSSVHREIGEFSVLKDELRRAAGELEEGRRREAERVRMQGWSEMARKVAHELKNPLTPMQMAADRVAKSTDPKVAEAGEILREEIQRLDEMARAFAHFGRPSEGPMSIIDLGELLAALSQRLSTEKTPIAIELPESPVEVEGHLEALDRVVRNLLSNAQEATISRGERGGPPGSPSPIRILLEGSDKMAEVRILDRGVGIPPELRDRIWLPDFTTKRMGTGLGLAMVRQVVEAHQGDVAAYPREGGGTEFRVRLPRIQRDPSETPRPVKGVTGIL
jgi:signal transduction histidine kinase